MRRFRMRVGRVIWPGMPWRQPPGYRRLNNLGMFRSIGDFATGVVPLSRRTGVLSQDPRFGD